MLGKDHGGVVGIISGGQEAMDASDAVELAPAEESLVCADENGEPFALVASLSPASGDLTWTRAGSLSEVIEKTVAMSQMKSMLRDTVRSCVYKTALARSIAHFKERNNRAPICLDIGAGTGLLSLLGVSEGAEHVVGIEMFDEMASIATEVVASNGMSDRITVVAGKSTDIDLGEGFVPDVLVSELLDSALLGESCLFSHGDAIARMMGPGSSSSSDSVESRVLPHSGEVYAQLIQSKDARCMRDMSHLPLNVRGGNSFSRSSTEQRCGGGWSLLPIHWREFSRYGSSALSDQHVVAHIDFFRSAEDPSFGRGHFVTDIPVTTGGTVDAVLMHWKVLLLSPAVDPERSIFYSTESGWRTSEGHWQDHWLQVLYPLPESVECEAEEAVRVSVSHDTIHMWLTASKAVGPKRRRDNSGCDDKDGESQCSCGWHLLMNPERILQMNDDEAAGIWSAALEQLCAHLTSSGRRCAAVDMGDGSLLSLTLGRMLQRAGAQGRVQVLSREQKQLSRLLFSQLVASNGLDGVVSVWDGEDLPSLLQEEGEEGGALLVDALFSDCYSYQMHALPTWQALSFFFQRLAVGKHLSAGAVVLPSAGRIMVAALQLEDLHVSHGLAGCVDGFDHSALDARMGKWHEHYYPYRLSNYRFTLLSRPLTVSTLDYKLGQAACGSSSTPIVRSGTCHCIAVWVDYELGEGGWAVRALDDSGRFRLHARQLLKFFAAPVQVSERSELEVTSQLLGGDSDFIFSVRL